MWKQPFPCIINYNLIPSLQGFLLSNQTLPAFSPNASTVQPKRPECLAQTLPAFSPNASSVQPKRPFCFCQIPYQSYSSYKSYPNIILIIPISPVLPFLPFLSKNPFPLYNIIMYIVSILPLFCQTKRKLHVLQHFFFKIFGSYLKTPYLCIRF